MEFYINELLDGGAFRATLVIELTKVIFRLKSYELKPQKASDANVSHFLVLRNYKSVLFYGVGV